MCTAGIDWHARILPVRVLGKCGGYDSDILDGVAWSAVLHRSGGAPPYPTPAHVLNLSLGGSGAVPAAATRRSSPLRSRTASRARSWSSPRATRATDVANDTPANCPGVISVGATTSAGGRALVQQLRRRRWH